jgi:hypothetical protein
MNGPAAIPASRLLLLAAGFVVWSSAFVALYAMLSVGCRLGWQDIDLTGGLTLQRAQLLAILVLHLGAGLWLALWLRGRTTIAKPSGEPADRFVRRAAYAAAVAAVAATLFSFAGVMFLSACH